MNKTAANADSPAAAGVLTIREAFRRHKDRVFFCAPGEEPWTYGAFAAQAIAWGADLAREQGVRPGDRVGLWLPNGTALAAMYFACYFYGWAAVPVGLHSHPEEVRYVLESARIKVVCVSAAQTVAAAGYGRPVWTPSPAARASLVPVSSFPEKNGENSFLLMHTSGSSSRPKAVVHAWDRLSANAVRFNAWMGVDERSRFFHVMPMTYMAGFLNTLLCPLMAGGSVVSAGAFDASLMLRFWEEAIRAEANVFWLSPTMLASLTRLDRHPGAAAYCGLIRPSVFVGTAPLYPSVKKAFEDKYGAEALESYGLSELLLLTASRSGEGEPGCVGSFPPSVELRAAEDGEIWARTPDGMLGYLDPDTQALTDPAQAQGGWFPTGDIGRVQNGRVYVTGRKKDLIIKGGFNVSPRAVEETIALHPAVERVCVVGIPHELYGERIAAVLQAKAGMDPASFERDVRDWCRSRVSAQAQPDFVTGIDDFPLGVSGKIQKKELLERLRQERPDWFI